MIDYVIYGKIIIDSIKLLDGTIVHEQLGGGGPQSAFGARVWEDKVGLVTRVGTNYPVQARNQLDSIKIDTQGVTHIQDLETLHGMMFYDDNDYIDVTDDAYNKFMKDLSYKRDEMISRNIILPNDYQNAKAYHLITEFMDEDMMFQALKKKEIGAILSLEPLIDYREWSNKEQVIEFLPNVDIVSPDWPSASGFADSEDPLSVMKWWIKQGVTAVSVRNGRKGSYVWDSINDEIWHVPIVDVPRVDPTGCGNSYSGGFCVGFEKYKDAKMAGAMGTVSATFMIQLPGLAPYTAETKGLRNQYLEIALNNTKKL